MLQDKDPSLTLKERVIKSEPFFTKEKFAKIKQPTIVYFLHNPITNLIKIGCTSNLQQRIKQLESAGGVELIVLGIREGGLLEEQKIHLKFQKLRVNSEWFKYSGKILDFIKGKNNG